MEKSASRVASVLSSTVLAAAVTLALGWPSRVNAVGDEEQSAQQQANLASQEQAPQNAALAQSESKIGDLVVSATLETSQTTPGRKVIRLECSNPTSGRIDGQIQVALTRSSGSGGERVMPTPRTAWRHKESIAVEPGATLVREVMMPKNIGAEVARIEKLQKAAEASETARYPNVYFGVVAEPLEMPATPGARNQVPQRLAVQKANDSVISASNVAPPVPVRSAVPVPLAAKASSASGVLTMPSKVPQQVAIRSKLSARLNSDPFDF
jgi:hypothetical protein